jgi:hypothetical protein
MFRAQGDEEDAFGLIDFADLMCNFWDLAQLIYDAGREDGSCWDADNISGGDIARIVTFAISIGVDLAGQVISQTVVDTFAPEAEAAATEAGGEAGAVAGGPVGAVIGAILAWLLARMARRRVVELGDLSIDLVTYLGQNMLMHGTPFPIDACQSCGRLPGYILGHDVSHCCDDPVSCLPDSVRETLGLGGPEHGPGESAE